MGRIAMWYVGVPFLLIICELGTYIDSTYVVL